MKIFDYNLKEIDGSVEIEFEHVKLLAKTLGTNELFIIFCKSTGRELSAPRTIRQALAQAAWLNDNPLPDLEAVLMANANDLLAEAIQVMLHPRDLEIIEMKKTGMQYKVTFKVHNQPKVDTESITVEAAHLIYLAMMTPEQQQFEQVNTATNDEIQRLVAGTVDRPTFDEV